MEQSKRRLILRVVAKCMLGFGTLVVVYVALSSFLSANRDAVETPTLRVDTSAMLPGQTRQVTWEGSPILIHRRSEAEIAFLEQAPALLDDPDSTRSRQPDWARNDTRSRSREWFVAIAAGTDFNCPLRFVPASDDPFMGIPWPGGYVDECRGSRYDPAGRVFADQFADRNLMVPPYSVREAAIVLGR